MKRLAALALLIPLIVSAPAGAAETEQAFHADLAAKSAQVETMRARAALSPSATVSTTLIEAENLLRQLRAAPPARRATLRSQLEAALARLELEIDAANRPRP